MWVRAHVCVLLRKLASDRRARLPVGEEIAREVVTECEHPREYPRLSIPVGLRCVPMYVCVWVGG